MVAIQNYRATPLAKYFFQPCISLKDTINARGRLADLRKVRFI
jgi:hypothetical protein